MIYDVTVEERWYYQVEAESKEEAREKVMNQIQEDIKVNHVLSRKIMNVCDRPGRKR